MSRQQFTFHIEITDTFGGEANYSWVRRYRVRASSQRGAINVLAKHYGGRWRREHGDFDCTRYNMRCAAVCCFVSYVDDGESIFDDVPFLNA